MSEEGVDRLGRTEEQILADNARIQAENIRRVVDGDPDRPIGGGGGLMDTDIRSSAEEAKDGHEARQGKNGPGEWSAPSGVKMSSDREMKPEPEPVVETQGSELTAEQLAEIYKAEGLSPEGHNKLQKRMPRRRMR